jgi:hypothetical protein
MRFLRVTMLWVLLVPHAVYFLGAASNQAVLIANHDKFPVMITPEREAAETEGGMWPHDNAHCVMTPQTHLNFLADIFDMRVYTESIGDMMLEFGVWLNTFAPFVWAALVIRKLYS